MECFFKVSIFISVAGLLRIDNDPFVGLITILSLSSGCMKSGVKVLAGGYSGNELLAVICKPLSSSENVCCKRLRIRFTIFRVNTKRSRTRLEVTCVSKFKYLKLFKDSTFATKQIQEITQHKTANKFHLAPEFVFHSKLSTENPLTSNPNING